MSVSTVVFVFFFFNDTATTEIYTLSLHDALPIWLSRSPHTRKVPSSKLGGNSLLFKAVVCLETTFKFSPLSKISSVTNGARASVICFHSVVVITFASHAKGPQFETGWKQSLV